MKKMRRSWAQKFWQNECGDLSDLLYETACASDITLCKIEIISREVENMPFFKTNDGVDIYYEVKGEGRPLFLLPGWTCTTKFWVKNIDELAKSCKVIAMDMRAHGQSEKVMHSHRISRCDGREKSVG